MNLPLVENKSYTRGAFDRRPRTPHSGNSYQTQSSRLEITDQAGRQTPTFLGQALGSTKGVFSTPYLICWWESQFFPRRQADNVAAEARSMKLSTPLLRPIWRARR